MVSFGGTINASGNPVNGVSVNSKSGLGSRCGFNVETPLIMGTRRAGSAELRS
jgi:hypothetical protein